MGMKLEEIEAEALKLPERERAELAGRLLESLDGPEDVSPEEIERAWMEEVRRRLEDYRSGKTVPIPEEEVLRRLGWDRK